MPAARAYVGIGSNLEQPVEQVQQAFRALEVIARTRLIACSPLYRSAPVGGPPGQPEFINAAASLATELAPDALLGALQAIEIAHGRQRTVHWGPRTLDLDLLLYDDLICNEPRLTLPHPRMHERAFVLQPLSDIAPALSIPGRGPLPTLIKTCPPLAIERL